MPTIPLSNSRLNKLKLQTRSRTLDLESLNAASSTLYDLRCLKAGNTKLPLLRQIRRLTIVPRPDPRDHKEGEKVQIWHEHEMRRRKLAWGQQVYGLLLEQDRYFDEAHCTLSSLPTDLIITPNLAAITSGRGNTLATTTILWKLVHAR
nr:hypothetical protein I302_01281 [Kwoniella bestiolae CBS 10118]OCF29768.1 hypothetical protein I302_01281 [Kwoniella bestiolae CBS 10118]